MRVINAMMGGSDAQISVVIPVHRSGATLRELLQRLLAVLDGTGESYEVVFVDDGSSDDSWEILGELHGAYPDRVVAVQLTRNYGQHNALMCGFHHARGRYVVTMDDDLQHPPEEVLKLLETIEATDNDVVYGVPENKRHRRWRNAGSALVNAFYGIVFKSRIQLSSFRIIRKELIDAILPYSLNYTFIDGLLAWNTQRIGQVIVQHHPRKLGRSGYSLGKLLVLAVNLFTNFSLLPLQLVSLVGMLASLSGFALGAYYLVRSFFGAIAIPGYASTIIAIFVFGGLQLMALGILGEYLGRLHLNVNRKPQYTIRSILGSQRGDWVRTGNARQDTAA